MRSGALLAGKAVPRKAGLRGQGRGRGCDLVARRGDEPPVIVELKLRFSLALCCKGIDRLALSERVYLAVPRPARCARGAARPKRPEMRRLCRRLGLGLMLVGRPAASSRSSRSRCRTGRAVAKRARRGCSTNSSRRSGDRNIGGCDRRADRHRLSPGRVALRPRAGLGGPMRLAELRAATGVAGAAAHPAAQRLRLVRAASARHLRAAAKRARRRSSQFADGHSPRFGRHDRRDMAPDDEHRRSLILDYFGGEARVSGAAAGRRHSARRFSSSISTGVRGITAPSARSARLRRADPAEPQVTEQSSMDLLYPAHLVFHYERLMSLAFAMCEQAGQRRCCSGSAARRCGASCAPICRNARRPWSTPTRPSSRSPAAGSI